MASISVKWWRYDLRFKRPVGTSRGVLETKPSYFLELTIGDITGRGEIPILPNLSPDDRPDLEEALERLRNTLESTAQIEFTDWREWPAIQFGLEQCFADLQRQRLGREFWLDSPWARGEQGMPINGLIWMGDSCFMAEEAERRQIEGFRCIKMKIGALDWQTEVNQLKDLRQFAGSDELELRVDANGAFTADNVDDRLHDLAAFDLHSIEQPVKPEERQLLAHLAQNSPVPIALDESLIGVTSGADRDALLDEIQPQYIVIKPSLAFGAPHTTFKIF